MILATRAAALLCLVWAPTYAGQDEWTAEHSAAESVYSVQDAKGNLLVVNCPEDSMYRGAYVTVDGNDYRSNLAPGFDLIVDGKTWPNPFEPDGLTSSDNFVPFWAALRKAKSIKIRVDGKTVPLPAKSVGTALPALTPPPDDSCYRFE